MGERVFLFVCFCFYPLSFEKKFLNLLNFFQARGPMLIRVAGIKFYDFICAYCMSHAGGYF